MHNRIFRSIFCFGAGGVFPNLTFSWCTDYSDLKVIMANLLLAGQLKKNQGREGTYSVQEENGQANTVVLNDIHSKIQMALHKWVYLLKTSSAQNYYFTNKSSSALKWGQFLPYTTQVNAEDSFLLHQLRWQTALSLLPTQQQHLTHFSALPPPHYHPGVLILILVRCPKKKILTSACFPLNHHSWSIHWIRAVPYLLSPFMQFILTVSFMWSHL